MSVYVPVGLGCVSVCLFSRKDDFIKISISPLSFVFSSDSNYQRINSIESKLLRIKILVKYI